MWCGGGSSPLARGKLKDPKAAETATRFIPTRAGKIYVSRAGRRKRPVHPHSRGENPHTDGFLSSGGGSSPLARGKYAGVVKLLLNQGFIPTRAGKIDLAGRMADVSWVHPHSRGENSASSLANSEVYGSSPLARGKSGRRPGPGIADRFIPTRAGKIGHQRRVRCQP